MERSGAQTALSAKAPYHDWVIKRRQLFLASLARFPHIVERMARQVFNQERPELPAFKRARRWFERRATERGSTRIVVLVVVIFLLGIAAGAFWFRAKRVTAETGSAGGLSDATKAVLKRLQEPVEVRFYVLLDPTADSLQAFAGRVDQLLTAYEQESKGKIKVVRRDSSSDAEANAARDDGLTAFDREKGSVKYLGLALLQGKRRETVPLLAPEWEAAVEPDLTRALSRLVAGSQPAAPAASERSDAATIEEVKRLVPNWKSVSVDAGARALRLAGIEEWKAAEKEMEPQFAQVRQRLSSGSEAEQEAARKQLQQLEADKAERFKQIAAKAQAQVEALQRLQAQP